MGESHSVNRETLAFEMAKLVQDWPASLDVTAQLLTDVKWWGCVEAYDPELKMLVRTLHACVRPCSQFTHMHSHRTAL